MLKNPPPDKLIVVKFRSWESESMVLVDSAGLFLKYGV